MQLFQRLGDFRRSLASAPESRIDPRFWDSAMYTLYPGADCLAPARPPVYGKSSVTHLDLPVPL
jgi:hypothetical protein